MYPNEGGYPLIGKEVNSESGHAQSALKRATNTSSPMIIDSLGGSIGLSAPVFLWEQSLGRLVRKASGVYSAL
jgi:hypothetical protein